MITVHHLEYSQSFRVLWLFERAWALTYELKLYERDPITRLCTGVLQRKCRHWARPRSFPMVMVVPG